MTLGMILSFVAYGSLLFGLKTKEKMKDRKMGMSAGELETQLVGP